MKTSEPLDWFLRNTPDFMQEILTYCSPNMLKRIRWDELGPKLVSSIRLNFTHSPGLELELKSKIESAGIFVMSRRESVGKRSYDQETRIQLGQKILEAYFFQIFKSDVYFLDFRPSRFFATEGVYIWRPQGFVVKREESVGAALRQLYRSLFAQDNPGLREALVQLDLIREDFSQDEERELMSLVHEYFGKAYQCKVRFKLSTFKSSFESWFRFMEKKDLKIGAEFVFLGLILINLQRALEELDVDFDVHEAFRRVDLGV